MKPPMPITDSDRIAFLAERIVEVRANHHQGRFQLFQAAPVVDSRLRVHPSDLISKIDREINRMRQVQ